MGGSGYLKVSGLERTLRDLRAFRIWPGTNEVLRLLIALSGITYAKSNISTPKSHITKGNKSLRKIVEEFTKRSREKEDANDPPAVGSLVHNELRQTAVSVSKSIESFGAVVNHLLMKYGDDVVNKQMLLLRIADCAIDIYAMAVVLSRASSSLRQDLDSANYERIIAQCWCFEAYNRIHNNLLELTSEQTLDNIHRLSVLSSAVCEEGDLKQFCPLNF